MSVRDAYDLWSSQYDNNENRTRDLEAIALREILADTKFKNILEIGCGTGKNTEWLSQHAKKLLGVDLSPGMLEKARTRNMPDSVEFVIADIREDWDFAKHSFDLVTFSLVLEHIADLLPIFNKAAAVMAPGAKLYIGELHPFKQYLGSRARFESSDGIREVESYLHHTSDFVKAAETQGLKLARLEEYFDEGDHVIPRILCMLFLKS